MSSKLDNVFDYLDKLNWDELEFTGNRYGGYFAVTIPTKFSLEVAEWITRDRHTAEAKEGVKRTLDLLPNILLHFAIELGDNINPYENKVYPGSPYISWAYFVDPDLIDVEIKDFVDEIPDDLYNKIIIGWEKQDIQDI